MKDKILIFLIVIVQIKLFVKIRYKNVKIIVCKNISYVSKINLFLKVLSNKMILLLDADYGDNKTIKF